MKAQVALVKSSKKVVINWIPNEAFTRQLSFKVDLLQKYARTYKKGKCQIDICTPPLI